MMPLAAGYQHFADGAPFAEIVLRHPSVKEVYFPWVGEPSGRPRLGFEEEDDPDELAAALHAHRDAGAVGAQLIDFESGKIAESGCLICRNGWIVPLED